MAAAVRAGVAARALAAAVRAGVAAACPGGRVLVLAAPAHAWRRPVPGPVARGFAYSPADPFAAGRHRGADFTARPGEAVRAACSGVVAYAGRGVVTLRCGLGGLRTCRWRRSACARERACAKAPASERSPRAASTPGCTSACAGPETASRTWIRSASCGRRCRESGRPRRPARAGRTAVPCRQRPRPRRRRPEPRRRYPTAPRAGRRAGGPRPRRTRLRVPASSRRPARSSRRPRRRGSSPATGAVAGVARPRARSRRGDRRRRAAGRPQTARAAGVGAVAHMIAASCQRHAPRATRRGAPRPRASPQGESSPTA